jgi:hypothetical protein
LAALISGVRDPCFVDNGAITLWRYNKRPITATMCIGMHVALHWSNALVMERAMDKIKGGWDPINGNLPEHYARTVSDVLHVEDELCARQQASLSKALDEAEDILGRLLLSGL